MNYLNTECSRCGNYDKHIDKVLDKEQELMFCYPCAAVLMEEVDWLGKGHQVKCVCPECLE